MSGRAEVWLLMAQVGNGKGAERVRQVGNPM